MPSSFHAFDPFKFYFGTPKRIKKHFPTSHGKGLDENSVRHLPLGIVRSGRKETIFEGIPWRGRRASLNEKRRFHRWWWYLNRRIAQGSQVSPGESHSTYIVTCISFEWLVINSTSRPDYEAVKFLGQLVSHFSYFRSEKKILHEPPWVEGRNDKYRWTNIPP